MKSSIPRVAILGGGFAGWWLGLLLAYRGIVAEIFDTDPSVRRTSIKHQEWLHSGAYYAALDDQSLAEECRDGYRWFMQWAGQYAPSAVHTGVTSYYLFLDKQRRDDTISRCQQWGIASPQIVGIKQVAVRERLLQGSLLKLALQVEDHPVDTTRLMESIAGQACARGVTFHAVASLNALQLRWMQTHWEVGLPYSRAMTFDALVLACGPAIPALLSALAPSLSLPITISESPMLVVCAPVASSLLAVPDRIGAPQLVPFGGLHGNGVTVRLHRFHAPATYPNLPALARRAYARALSHWFTGINGIVPSGSFVNAHLHICPSVALQATAVGAAGGSIIAEALAPVSGAPASLFVLYPGSFTAAPIAAQTCVNQLIALVGAPTAVSSQPSTLQPRISSPQYCASPSGRLVHHPVLGLRLTA